MKEIHCNELVIEAKMQNHLSQEKEKQRNEKKPTLK